MHEVICGGCFFAILIAHKIIRTRFYWPTLFRDTHDYIRKCLSCQKFPGKQNKTIMFMKTISICDYFTQWGLDVIGPINPISSIGHSYIITTTNYFTQ